VEALNQPAQPKTTTIQTEATHVLPAPDDRRPAHLQVAKHLGRDLLIGIAATVFVGGVSWAGAQILPSVLNYGCPASVDDSLAHGYRFLERKDAASAAREANDIVDVSPKCAKAHALWAEAAASLMALDPTKAEDNRRLARREAATAANLGYHSDAVNAVLSITQISDGGS